MGLGAKTLDLTLVSLGSIPAYAEGTLEPANNNSHSGFLLPSLWDTRVEFLVLGFRLSQPDNPRHLENVLDDVFSLKEKERKGEKPADVGTCRRPVAP